MKKRITLWMLSVVVLLFIGAAYADGSFSCLVENGQATITGYQGTNTSVTVPSRANGYPIVAISPYAFATNTMVRSVTIEEGVTSIGEGAFYNCYALSYVFIPDSVHTIGSDLFYGCRNELTVYCSEDSYAAFYIRKQQWNVVLNTYSKDHPGYDPDPWDDRGRDPYEKDSEYKLGIKARNKNDKEEALEHFKASADKGYAMGQYEYANCMENGWGCEKDYDESYRYYRKAVLQGNSTAEAALGRCYLWGRGVRKDYDEAFSWFDRSADNDDDLGQLWLGYCYQNGYGTSKSISRARYYYELSAEQGNKNALKRLEELD